jgi:fimbrial chaperone protein
MAYAFHLIPLATAALLGAAVSATAFADGFQVFPTLLEGHGEPLTVTIQNSNDQRMYLMAEVYAWSKDAAGGDVFKEADDAIASPPAMWVPPHGSYTLRVQLPKAAGVEKAYRLAIQQLPDRSEIAAGRIVFAVTQNIPAFAEPDAVAPASLSARLAGPSAILFSNSGGRRARITAIRQDGQTLASGLLGYVLAQSSTLVRLSAPVHPGKLEVVTEQGERSLDVR